MTTARARRLLPALLLLALAATARGAGLPKVPDDFEIRLVANVPAVLYPCQVATAPDGKLFIAEDPMDQVGPYESDHGKILLMRDGKDPALFAEGFRAIFGMAWHDGALYVSHMPYLTVLRDTDGDGKADQRKELFKDLGITNNKGLNDHIVSGIQFGIDGRLYISTGDKGVLKATGPDGRTAQVVGGGTLRCRPDGTEIEVFTTGTRNHLEPNLDARDNLFTYDNTDDGDGWWTRVTHHVDGAYYGYPYDYHDHPGRFLNRMAEYGGGSPCGGVVYKEDAWPEKYRGRAFWAEWGKRKVSGFSFVPDGASFKVGDVVELAEAGDSGEFRPLDVALSYDGKTLYVADWGMGGWGSKTEKVGRVYAISYKGPEVATRPRGQDSDPLDAQFQQLDHPSYNERTRAQAAIIKAGRAGRDRALAMLLDPRVDPVAKRHLVWIVDAIAGGTPDAAAVLPALNADLNPADDVRAQVVRAFGERRDRSAAASLAAMLGDASPVVRLQAIIALGRIGEAKSVPALLPFLTDPDRYLAFSARQAIRRIGAWDAVAAELKSGDTGTRAAILTTLELVYDRAAVGLLEGVVADPKAPADERARALSELALVHRKAPPWDGKWWGTRPSRGKPPAKTIDWEASPAILKAIESGLTDPAAPVRLAAVSSARETSDPGVLPALRARFVSEPEPAVRAEIARALGGLGDRAAIPLLVAALNDPAVPAAVRAAALAGVEQIGGKESVAVLVGILARPGATFDEESQARVIAALGRFKAKEAVPALLGRLRDRSEAVRAASAEALGRIGQVEGVAPEVRATLADASIDVRKAALGALAALKDREAIPAMLRAADEEPTRYEATLGLAALPDVRALQVYLRGLTDRSQAIRKASSAAIAAIRDQAQPVLDRLAGRREISPGALPELRKIFGRIQPVTAWHVMGPFPADERAPISLTRPVDPAQTVPGPDGTTIAWRTASGDAEDGKVDLNKLFSDNNKKSAFAAAEVDSPVARPARMAVGCDDTMTVWLNGKMVHRIEGNHSFEPDMGQFDVELKQGKNILVVKAGNDGGNWEFSAGVSTAADHAFLKGPETGGFDPDRFRAEALKGRGDADRGKVLFSDLKGLACVKCHVVAGQGGAIGPELSGVAAKYPREELIDSVLYPSRRISSGYEPIIVAAADGRVLTGLVKSDNADGLEIEDAEGKRTKLAKADIEERKPSDVSIMPSGIVEGITPQDFADLILYLETLKDAAANQGKPAGK